MLSPIASRRVTLVLTLLAAPFLVGSSCAVLWSSGSGSSQRPDPEDDEEKVVIISSGNFGDPAVAGLHYESGSQSGTTDAKGTFLYENEQPVRFFIGDISLGQPVPAKSLMSPADVVEEDTSGKAEVNIRRLLKSLDAIPGDEIITIPEAVATSAVTTNSDVAAAIEFLDFSDDQLFVNSASQLVAALTADYPFTAMLVEAEAVQPIRSVER